MYTETDFNIIKNIIIKDIPEVSDIILFGSYANGTAGEDSDIDIMILLDREPDWKERHEILNQIYRDSAKNGYPIDFLLKTREKFENDKDSPTITATIFREGKWLWKKN